MGIVKTWVEINGSATTTITDAYIRVVGGQEGNCGMFAIRFELYSNKEQCANGAGESIMTKTIMVSDPIEYAKFLGTEGENITAKIYNYLKTREEFLGYIDVLEEDI
ncbi:MAG: hypothetical protein OQK32_04360 [Gammaproteobacteria bacterium]|nr:hypothetical protein [Gammaproteobacteria bacterium]